MLIKEALTGITQTQQHALDSNNANLGSIATNMYLSIGVTSGSFVWSGDILNP